MTTEEAQAGDPKEQSCTPPRAPERKRTRDEDEEHEQFCRGVD
jgi:hypothetical protein